ncbi:LLM class F420-dependent oxidoreductase [Halioglobus japonicus]|uniref:LLM class F420-dependent oxidoreductase n=1 Tax=Halioglobus japonicus TaxID=930805 RepID=A0AAP8SNW3_9GAMM|nr:MULTISPECIES: LLM class F420-dependent oxidoreductase [Halioglobus]AQA18859.1 LLM class F420-dependent oxidoreductase [Halioglobus japonicus]KZX53361.1 LLM class F420-dependent oxidoreductase [Halioglobus sp. HI00S01]PLW86896.1 LLM class F420-dependent oxidoreductase [Halioglobus japonicus]GHD23476.1 LLM class F420-dependent oxidoreductase [Halioglobus japonicus]
MAKISLGLNLGYWGALCPGENHTVMAQEAERLGYDSVWMAESWGNDCFTPLAWIGAQTSTIRLGTSIAQLSARTPAACAMATLAIDALSGGRFSLGLGVSGPQVVEGWYGQPYSKPVTRTREYVDIVRKILAREAPVTSDGEFYPLPYDGPGSWGMGKPLKPITHPIRKDVPIFIGAEGPKNVTQTAEIADGWLPLYYSPYRQDVYADQLTAAKPGFEICPTVLVNINDDMEQALYPVKAMLGFYIGGMGSAKRNFHKELMARMGFPDEADEVQRLFLEGKRDEAIAAVPDQFADDISLAGPKDRIKERLVDWENSPVTTMLVNGDVNFLREMAELAL